MYLFFFVSFSVVVSAKDGDNSVHTSIQSLIRHLLEKHGNLKYKKKAKKKKKKTKEFVIDENGFQNLTQVEIPDVSFVLINRHD